MKPFIFLFSLIFLSCSSPTEKKTSPAPKKTAIAPTPPIKKIQTEPAPSWKKSTGTPSVDLFGVSFLSDKEASVVADMAPGNGPVLHTQDAGVSWVIGTTATEILTDVSFDGKKGAAVGYAGQISTTEDGARSWKVARRDEETILRGVARRGDIIVAVGDNSLLVSKDAGQNFEASELKEPLEIEDVFLWSDSDCAAVTSDGSLLTTNDLWKTYTKKQLTKEPLFGVARYENQLYAVGGKGSIIVVGEKDAKTLPAPVSVDLFDVAFDGKFGVIVGTKGTILTSKNGQSWLKEDVAEKEDLSAVAVHGNRAIVVGTRGTILSRTLGE
jgi:photosystem II stability/assembly factor-like uncharacterized protein